MARARYSAGHARPGEHPRDGDGGHRNIVPRRYGAERIAQRQTVLEIWRLEASGAAAPVVFRQLGQTLGAEAVRQESRLHRAVADYARAVLTTPRNLALGDVATDQREGGLQRIHVTNLLASREQFDVEVRDAAPANFPLIDEPGYLTPRILDGSADLVGPMELVEIDALHSEPAERRLTLASDGLRREDPSRPGAGIALVPHDPALREDVGALSLGNFTDEATYHLLRVTQPVRGR